MIRLLYFCPFATGGIAAYGHEQANALVKAGAEVVVITTTQFAERSDARYELVKAIKEKNSVARTRTARLISTCQAILARHDIVAEFTRREGFGYLLFAAYSEYLAPLWSWRFSRLSRDGVVVGAVVHDPVRDYVVGPAWWHKWSIRCGYSFVREAFVHDAIELETGGLLSGLRISVIPQGLYHFPGPTRSRESMRERLGIPHQAKVLLSFGHIRDGKNLGLVLQMIKRFPNVYLIVAGHEQSSRQKTAGYYQDLANSLGVHDRCRWLFKYIPDDEVANLFLASDLTVLAYGRQFHSASGVLNVSVAFRRPCLASGGEGNLKNVVRRYGLGVWVQPDDLDSLCTGLQKWLDCPPQAQWEDYEADHSWDKNAEIILSRMANSKATRLPKLPQHRVVARV